MHKRRILAIALVLALITVLGFSQPVATNFYSFNKRFITTHFAEDSAIGSLTVSGWKAASQTHARSCGGNDGELHIGVLLEGVDIANNQMPLSLPRVESDAGWGIVAELPNTRFGDGKALLSQNKDEQATFTGYFRVWDEGHAQGVVHPSNPHHIFEIHPAWAFKAGTAEFDRPDLVDSIADYSGFGATKFKPIFNALNEGTWPRVFQDDDLLHIELLKSGNFFQLPIIVQEINEIDGGHESIVEVFTDKAHKNLLYSELRCITITGSPVDSELEIGKKVFWLGVFSVNLRKALDGTGGSTSEEEAVVIPDSVEFFVFGRALKTAVKTCQ